MRTRNADNPKSPPVKKTPPSAGKRGRGKAAVTTPEPP
ncbi:hypothetical protein Tco_0484940, partial [Tanacetum coccineum]